MAAITTAPAAAQVVETEPCKDEEGNLVFDEVVQWIKAPEQKLGNLGATDFGEFPTWSGEAPTQSVEEGAGGGSLQSRVGNPVTAFEYQKETSGYFQGTFTGCINQISWDLYLLSPAPPAGGGVVSRLQMYIDGTLVHLTAGDPGPDINAPAEGDTGLLYKLQFAFTGLYQAMNSSPGDFAPLDGEHTIELTMFSQYLDDAQGMYVYDTTEAPSRLTFNKTAGLGSYTKLEPSI
jgi:hypothetical protein